MLIAPPRAENAESLLALLDVVTRCLAAEPAHIALSGRHPIAFVGDTHGDLAASQMVVERYLAKNHLVFLGDYVDRAPDPGGSLANIAYLLRCKLAYPTRITLLRGNHEFRRIFRDGGFGDELAEIDTPARELISAFERTFAQLPYVVTTDNGAVALHGGLPDVWRRDELLALPKGVVDYMDHALVSQTVWNDNVATAAELTNPLGFVDSPRVIKSGYSLLYGEEYLRSKLEIIGGRVLIRGHDFRMKGYTLGDRVLTLMTTRDCAEQGLVKEALVARLDPRRKLTTARDLTLDVLPLREAADEPFTR